MAFRQLTMFTLGALVVILPLRGVSAAAEKDRDSADGAAAAGWLEDASKGEFPDRAASGRIDGRPFKPDVVRVFPYHETGGKAGDPPAKQEKVDGVMLELQQGDKAGAPGFVVFCVGPSGETVDGKTFLLPPGELFKQTATIGKGGFFPVAGVQVTRGPTSDAKPKIDLFPKATMRLTFGKRKNDRLPGQIYLCVDDGRKTLVAGSFEAVVQEEKK